MGCEVIGHIKIKERGSTPRVMRKKMTQWLKDTWRETGQEFHTEHREARFTEEHGRRARYAARSRKYQQRKRLSPRLGGGPGKANPLVFSGESQRASRLARITSTSKGVRVAYPGLRKLNFRNPKSRARMAAEFRSVLPREARSLTQFHDGRLDKRIDQDNSASTETVV